MSIKMQAALWGAMIVVALLISLTSRASGCVDAQMWQCGPGQYISEGE